MTGNYGNKINSGQYALSPQVMFGIVLCLVWTRYTTFAYMIAVMKRFPFLDIIADYVYPVLIISLLVLSFPYIRKRIGFSEIIIYLATFGALMISLVYNEDNEYYIQRELQEILLAIVPMVFLGACYEHKLYKTTMFWASIVSVVSRILFQVYALSSGRQMEYDSMGVAYRILPSTMYLIYWAFEMKKFRYWICALLSVALVFIFGTRGPILCMLVYLCVGFLHINLQKRSWFITIASFCFLVLAGYLVLGNALDEIANRMSNLFEDWGFSTRVFDFYLEGEIGDLSGRDDLASRAWEAIGENPIMGYGAMGDRAVFRGGYTHNLFLELWFHYGLFLGTALIFVIIGLVVKAISCQRNDHSMILFLLMLVSFVFVKLMVSNSYIREEYFFFMLGVMIAAIRDKNKTSLLEDGVPK